MGQQHVKAGTGLVVLSSTQAKLLVIFKPEWLTIITLPKLTTLLMPPIPNSQYSDYVVVVLSHAHVGPSLTII
jgi:hypothetical protein